MPHQSTCKRSQFLHTRSPHTTRQNTRHKLQLKITRNSKKRNQQDQLPSLTSRHPRSPAAQEETQNCKHHKKLCQPGAPQDEETKKQQLNCQTSTESWTHENAKRGNSMNSFKTRLSRPAASHALRACDFNGKRGRRHSKLPSSPNYLMTL